MSKNNRWFPMNLLLLLAACTSKPQFINHLAPDMPIAFNEFTNVGCPSSISDQPCGANSTLAALGCDEIQIPPSLLGGLKPSYPIAVCQLIHDQANAETRAEIEKELYFFYTGGLFGSYVRYVIFQDGEFRLIKSEDEFRAIYAPVDTPEEALSYVLAVTNLSAYYGLAYDPAYKYEVGMIEDTNVTPEPDGYKLHLYRDAVFGCGPHWISAVDVHISFEGAIKEIGQTQVFRDPNMDEVCVD